MPVNPRYKKPDEFGRKPETWPPIPFEGGRRIPNYLVDPIEEWMRTKRGSPRSLPIAAPLMVLICALHKAGHYLPTRKRLAEALNTGTPSIDAALSTALGYEEVAENYQTEAGEVTHRASVRRHRYIVPSPELLALYDDVLETKGSKGGV